MQIEIPLQGALSIENIRVNVPSVFTVAIGTDEEAMTNAAIRLLGQDQRMVMKQAEDIILGQLRQVIASMRIEDINRDRDLFLNKVQTSLEPELKKIGLVLINVNIKDITDESGYIEAIGRKAASQAIQQAKIDVAEQEKLGAIGVADAERERQIQVASAEKLREIGTKEADRDKQVQLAELGKDAQVGQQRAAYEQEVLVREADQAKRIRVAEANAAAVAGENKAKADIAQANADLRVREADAFRVSETRQREADAQVREAQYMAEARAADAQAKKLEAEKRAELEAVAKAMKAQVVVDAEADAERVRIAALAEAGDLRQARSRSPRPVRDPGQEGRGHEDADRELRRRPAGLPDADARAPRHAVGERRQRHRQHQVRQGGGVGRRQRHDRQLSAVARRRAAADDEDHEGHRRGRHAGGLRQAAGRC